MRRIRTGGLVVALAVLAGGLAAAPSSAGTTESDWTEIAHARPANQDTYFYDAWTTGNETWAVGMRRTEVTGVFEFRTWAQRCIAGVCSATYPRDFESPPYTSNSLQGVSGTSSSDVWAVGYARINGVGAGTTHHFDGSAWSAVPNPVVNGALYDVSAKAADDVWAVGEDSGASTSVALHWNGSSWTRVPVEHRGRCTPYGSLRAVAAEGRWPLVVGECRVGTALPEPMVLAYKDGRWVRQHLVGVGVDDDLRSVAWVGQQAWVGGSAYGGGGTTLTSRWKRGAGWATVSGGVPGSVNAIAGDRPRDVWAVGTNGCCYRLALHWDGTTWTPDDPGEYGFLNGLAIATDGTPWAVGQEGIDSLIIRYDGPLGVRRSG